MKIPLGPTRIPDTVPRPLLVVARTLRRSGARRTGSVRGIVTLADSGPGPRFPGAGRRRGSRRPGAPVLGLLVLAALTVTTTAILRVAAPSHAWVSPAIGGGVALVGAAFLLMHWAAAARLVTAPGSFAVVGRDHRLDLVTIDRVTASWPDPERLDALQHAGRDPRWARWTADGMRERHEDDRHR